jgi:hypothetical protein
MSLDSNTSHRIPLEKRDISSSGPLFTVISGMRLNIRGLTRAQDRRDEKQKMGYQKHQHKVLGVRDRRNQNGTDERDGNR